MTESERKEIFSRLRRIELILAFIAGAQFLIYGTTIIKMMVG